MASASSLSSVVSNLVRASMGASANTSVTDDDLDQHVAELILKEAKQKEARYFGKEGIRVYQPDTGLPDVNLPKPNKRFLNNIIRNVDDHNASIIHSQAKAAADAKEEIEKQARRMRRARADEAALDRLRRLMGTGVRRASEGDDRSVRRPREDGECRRSERSKRDVREEESQAGPSGSRQQLDDVGSSREGGDSRYERRSRRHRDREEGVQSRSSRHEHSHNSRDRDQLEDDSKYRRRRRDMHKNRSRSRSEERDGYGRREGSTDRTQRRSSSSSLSRAVGDTDRPKKRSRDHSRSRSPPRSNKSSSKNYKHSTPRYKPDSTGAADPTSSRRLHPLAQTSTADDPAIRSPSPDGPSATHAHAPIPSKMDRYFDPSYDPLLDTYPTNNLTLNDPVPESAFEHWSNMIELVKMRKEDKADRKRREKEEKRENKGKKRKKGVDEDEEDEKNRRIRLGLERPSVMDVKYVKRGAMREWDVGKEVT
ncbi:hypothetical protein FRB98_001214 [Tulasnella sp. 332]|nr:hypothetical protein FRB98_001214 [Tulasnella sp. 332]